jgi:hypothetical protein
MIQSVNSIPPTPSIVVTDHSDERQVFVFLFVYILLFLGLSFSTFLFLLRLPPPAEPLHRAVHKIRLSALCDNYSKVESAANQQRCSVIVVVKADGYGHGAISTALFLADYMGADAFAVATLEEGIALRKALQQTPPGASFQSTQPQSVTTNISGTVTYHVSSLFQGQSETQTTFTPPNATANSNGIRQRRIRRAFQIRILVLGPPISFPKCFSDYFFYNIEVMISGPEVATAMLEWVCNTEERKRIQVERAATEAKELAMNLQGHSFPPSRPTAVVNNLDKKDSTISDASTGEFSEDSNTLSDSVQRYHPPSATLGNCTGMDLAKEVRKILKNQKFATTSQPQGSAQHGATTSDAASTTTGSSASTGSKNATTQVFAGIEVAAKMSRSRHKAIANETFVESGEDDATVNHSKQKTIVGPRKRLRWHALVDSGMGR